MIDTQAIRNKILDFAMRGQLTEQLPEDGIAEELYQKIQFEKQLQNDKGTIKKGKPLPEINDDEVPYEIPTSWLWVRVGAVAEIAGGTTPNSSEIIEKGTIPYFKVSDMNTPGNETHMIHAINFVSDNYNGKIFPPGTTIFPKNGGAALTNKRRILTVPSAVDLNTGGCTPIIPTMVGWIRLFMETVDFGKMDTGSNIPTVNATNLKKQFVALPPLAEQQRIVEKVDQVFSVLDTIDSLQAQYADNLTVLKAKLIDAAIQGKLTQQLPEDGTAEELYQQIQDEKQTLTKAGKIKKEKPLPDIRDEEIPFEIPKSWKWVRVSDLCKSIMDGDHQPPPQVEEGIPFLVISNISKGYFDLQNIRYVPCDYYNDLSPERTPERGDVLFSVTGSFGIPVVVDIDVEFCFQRHIALLKPLIDTSYLYYTLKSGYVQKRCDDIAIGTAQRTVGIKQLRRILIPLPPLAEQKRIAQKTDELMSRFKN